MLKLKVTTMHNKNSMIRVTNKELILTVQYPEYYTYKYNYLVDKRYLMITHQIYTCDIIVIKN